MMPCSSQRGSVLCHLLPTLFLFFSSVQVQGCSHVLFNSSITLTLSGRLSASGRPVYENDQLVLYHLIIDMEQGLSRWMLGNELESRSAIGFVDSWALAPHMISEASPFAKWQLHSASSGWVPDPVAKVHCVEEQGDSSVFICSQINPSVCGFFVPTTVTRPRVYTNVANSLNLYQVNGRRWLVSHDAPGSHAGVAFFDCEANSPRSWTHECPHQQWKVLAAGTWRAESNATFILLHGGAADDTESVFVQFRSAACFRVESETQDSSWVQLNNGMPFPVVGLGTGGFTRQQTEDVLPMALEMGYRVIDSASAYNNEDVVGAFFGRGLHHSTVAVPRRLVSITTKLWPTHLGFDDTLSEFTKSAEKLGLGYVDVYMLHWPDCYNHFSWMDCSKRTPGNWRQSYRALERLYAEGKTRSIGVSNFDHNLMVQLMRLRAVTPQILQNHIDPSRMTRESHGVFRLCQANGIFLQAYSVLRTFVAPNASPAHKRIWQQARRIGNSLNNKDPGQVIMRWLIQHGLKSWGLQIGVIPRSTKHEHLASNLDVQSGSWRLSEGHIAALEAAIVGDVTVHLDL